MFWYKWSWLSSALFLVIVGVSGQMPGFSGIVYLDQARSNQPMTHDGAGTGRIFLVPYLVYRAPDPSPRSTLAKYQLRYTETRYLVWLLATCDSNGEIARCKHGVTIARLVQQVHLTLQGVHLKWHEFMNEPWLYIRHHVVKCINITPWFTLNWTTIVSRSVISFLIHYMYLDKGVKCSKMCFVLIYGYIWICTKTGLNRNSDKFCLLCKVRIHFIFNELKKIHAWINEKVYDWWTYCS